MVLAVTLMPTAGSAAVSSLGQPQPLVLVNDLFPPAPLPAATEGTAAGFHTMEQTRLVDTRDSSVRLAPTTTLEVPVAGRAGIPTTGVVAAALNLTVTGAVAEGYVTVMPCGSRATTSTVNFRAGADVANLAVVGLSPVGSACVTSSAPAHVIVDVSGWYSTDGSLFSPVVPFRLIDTRTAGSRTPVAAFSSFPLPVAGRGDVPASGVTAVALNVTSTEATAPGYLGVRSCTSPRPGTSNLNVGAQGTASNSVIAAVDGQGRVCFASNTTAQLIVDIVGWFGPGAASGFAPLSPRRIIDTRTNAAVTPTRTLELEFSGQSGVALNVTSTEAAAAGFLTVWPCGTERPTSSSVNFQAGTTIANAVTSAVGSNGKVCVYASQTTHVVVDQMGSYAAGVPRPVSPGTGNTKPTANTGAQAIAWARTQIGRRYASINPYRFGESVYGRAWDCAAGQATCSRTDMFGTARTVAAGDYVYDCSGLIVASWLRGSVDLVKQGASWTEPMYDVLPRVSRATARPGDILLFDYGTTPNDTDHAGMFVSDAEMIHAGSCTGYSGVCLRPIDWAHVVAVVRPFA